MRPCAPVVGVGLEGGVRKRPKNFFASGGAKKVRKRAKKKGGKKNPPKKMRPNPTPGWCVLRPCGVGWSVDPLYRTLGCMC